MWFAHYTISTGEISGFIEPAWVGDLGGYYTNETSLIEWPDDLEKNSDKFSIADGKPVSRPALFDKADVTLEANGKAGVRFDVPAGTVVFHAREEHRIDDGEFHFTTFAPGRYIFQFEPPKPWQPFTLRIHAE